MTKASYETLCLTHDKWINPDTREMWIHGVDRSDPDIGEPGVEYMMATRVIKNLHYFLGQDEKEAVTIMLHSCGGDWEEGMAIYDTITAMPYPVTMLSYTSARSMSSIIFQAADRRIMMPHSYFLMHYGYYCVDGTNKAVYSAVDYDKICMEQMLKIYVDSARKSPKFKGKRRSYIKKAIVDILDKKEDVYLTPKEAIEWGFADEVLSKLERI